MILTGDCRELMATLDAESMDAIVTDPPYELNFMGRGWDSSGVAYDVGTWTAALRVQNPEYVALIEKRLSKDIQPVMFAVRDTDTEEGE